MSMEVTSSAEYLAQPKHSWWALQSPKEKLLIIIAGVSAVLALAFLISTVAVASSSGSTTTTTVYIEVEGNKTTPSVDKVQICSSDQCIYTAKLLKSRMDETVEPCSDFYSFACGNFIKDSQHASVTQEALYYLNQQVLELLTRKPSLSRNATDNARILYNRCITQDVRATEGLASLKSVIQLVLNTSWPIATEGEWKEEGFDPSLSIETVLRYIDQKFFTLSLEILPDITNTTSYSPMLYLASTNTGIFEERVHYSEIPVDEVLKMLVCKINPKCQENILIDEDIRGIKETSKRLLVSGSKDIERKKYFIVDLQNNIPQVNWTSFFEVIFRGTDVKMNKETGVLTNLEEIQKYVNVLHSISKRNIANLIGLYVVYKWGSVLSADVSSFLQQERRAVCLAFVNDVMGFAVGKLYSDAYMPSDTIEEATKVTSDIKIAFERIVNESDWMDSYTRGTALKKVRNMKTSAVAPNWALNDYQLNERYKPLKDISDLTFEDGVLMAKEFFIKNQINLLLKKVDRLNDWPVPTPVQVNAFYEPATNSMFYPLGILDDMFYNRGRPRALNFGGFGFVGGHEVTHGFDSRGKDYDEDGAVRHWWSYDAANRFQAGADCIKEQYSSIKDGLSGLYLNGTKTLQDDIADNGGLRAAFKAYRDVGEQQGGRLKGMEKYSEDQLFFISAAQFWCSKEDPETNKNDIQNDDHSIGKYRATVPFQNFPEFSRAFRCSKGTGMNPRHKCKIW